MPGKRVGVYIFSINISDIKGIHVHTYILAQIQTIVCEGVAIYFCIDAKNTENGRCMSCINTSKIKCIGAIIVKHHEVGVKRNIASNECDCDLNSPESLLTESVGSFPEVTEARVTGVPEFLLSLEARVSSTDSSSMLPSSRT